jgi:hypothetical protein
MEIAHRFIRKKLISQDLQNRVIDYIYHNFEEQDDIIDEEENEFIGSLSEQLRNEVTN